MSKNSTPEAKEHYAIRSSLLASAMQRLLSAINVKRLENVGLTLNDLSRGRNYVATHLFRITTGELGAYSPQHIEQMIIDAAVSYKKKFDKTSTKDKKQK